MISSLYTKTAVTVHSIPVTGKNPCKICKTNKFVAQMDFYLTAIRFLTDLAVTAKSCLNSNKPLSKSNSGLKKYEIITGTCLPVHSANDSGLPIRAYLPHTPQLSRTKVSRWRSFLL